MEIEVARAGEKPFLVHPKLFVNDRTRQVMANPDIKSSPLQDLYVSPIDFDPGQLRLQLAKGESGRMGDMEVRFERLRPPGRGQRHGRHGGRPADHHRRHPGGHPERPDHAPLKPLYRLNPASGSVETPPVPLPGGGAIFVAGINASDGAVQLEVTGISSNPAKLSVDVTRKPLIQLVWFGLYIVLLGGALRDGPALPRGAGAGAPGIRTPRPPAGPPGCGAGRPCGCGAGPRAMG